MDAKFESMLILFNKVNSTTQTYCRLLTMVVLFILVPFYLFILKGFFWGGGGGGNQAKEYSFLIPSVKIIFINRIDSMWT